MFLAPFSLARIPEAARDQQMEEGVSNGPLQSLSLFWCISAIILSTVPLLYPSIPPLTDLPAHMSRFMIQMDHGKTTELAQWYSFHWNLLPNLGTDLIAWCLEPVFGLPATMKIIVLMIVSLQISGYLLLSRAAYGRVMPTVLFAVPLALGNPFQFGFLNFTLGAGLATLALAWWISPSMSHAPRRRWLIFCVVGLIVWICHLAAWAMLCVLVGCCELSARLEGSSHKWRALCDGFVASSCLLLPQLAYMAWPKPTGHLPTEDWFLIRLKFYYLRDVLAERWPAWDIACALLLVALIGFAWRSRRFELHKGLALATLVLFGLFLAMPGKIYGSAFADMRMTPTIFALALIGARPTSAASAKAQRVLMIAGALFVIARLAGSTVSMAMWDQQIRKEQGVLDALPLGAQVISFSARPCILFTSHASPRDTHLASYALMRRHAFANDQWAMPGGQLLQIHNPVAGRFVDAERYDMVGEECQGFNQLQTFVSMMPKAVPYLLIVWHVPEFPLAGWHPIKKAGPAVVYER